MIFEKIRTRLEKLIYDKSYLFNREDRNEDKYFFQLMCLKDEIMPLINQVEAEYNNAWIPCSDRLPEKSGKYLITQKRYRLEDRNLIRPIAIETDYVEFDARDNKWCRARFFEVIAWMPLPKPYKPKGE